MLARTLKSLFFHQLTQEILEKNMDKEFDPHTEWKPTKSILKSQLGESPTKGFGKSVGFEKQGDKLLNMG